MKKIFTLLLIAGYAKSLWATGLTEQNIVQSSPTELTQLVSNRVAAPVITPMGMTTLRLAEGKGPTTVFYPTLARQQALQRGPFVFDVAVDALPQQGNRRLIVISHGSGGAPWPLTDLARSFIAAGFVVAMPEHAGDNYKNKSNMGPDSWKLRPQEVSSAIDAVAADSRFAALLDTQRVGVYGPSAGGFTALVLGGAVWSPANFQKHCLNDTAADFGACAGLVVQLRGNWLDSFKLAGTRLVHRLRYGDTKRYAHTDPRVAAVLAAVPIATAIDMSSFVASSAAAAPVAIGLICAGQDIELQPRFHIDAVRAACARCTLVADLPFAGHDSLFSPWPQDFAATLGVQAIDPAGFDRSTLPQVYAQMVQFFAAHLLTSQAATTSPITKQTTR